MSGKIRGEQVKDNSITGEDVDELTLILPHLTTHKCTLTSSSDMILIRFNAAGSNTMGSSQVNNRFVSPAVGSLKMVKIRSTGTPGQTEIALLKESNGTENFGNPGSPVETSSINMSSANTIYEAYFSNNSFNADNILGVRINPTNVHGNVDITCVWELDFSA